MKHEREWTKEEKEYFNKPMPKAKQIDWGWWGLLVIVIITIIITIIKLS